MSNTTQQAVSPAIQKKRDEAAAKLAQEQALQGSVGAPEQEKQSGDTKVPETQETAQQAPEGVSENTQQSDAGAETPAPVEQGAEQTPPAEGITLDFSNKAPEQQAGTPIDLNQVTLDTQAELRQGGAEEAAAELQEEAINFFALRAKEVFGKFEAIAHPERSFDKVAYQGIHQMLRSFLFDALRKAQSKDFIGLMDVIIGTIRADAKAKVYYEGSRFFRGAEKQPHAYAALMNILFDMAKTVNRSTLLSMDIGKHVGDRIIGDKLNDYISRV